MAEVQTAARTRRRRRLARSITAAVAGAVIVASTGLAIATAGAETEDDEVEATQEWELEWSDEFDGASGTQPSTSDWQYDTGTSYEGGPSQWGTGEDQTYTADASNISMDGDGNLEITALRDSSGTWTSARIETVRSDFKPPSGGTLRIEGRLQLPQVSGDAALGYWSAFWALGSPYRGNYWNWPSVGEIDVMENVNGLDWTFGTLHCGTSSGGPCNETSGLYGQTYCSGSCGDGFHTYSFEWDDTGDTAQLRWYVDDVLYHTINESDLPADTWADMTEHAGYFILLNLAMGGAFPDGVSGQTTPTSSTESGHSMLVDYVRVYTAGGSDDGTSEEPTTGGETTTSDDGGGDRDAYSAIEATSFDDSSGVATSDGSIGPLADGEWVKYEDVDFGSTSPLDFVARVASGAGSGVSGLVEVRLDSSTASPIGSISVASTGGWTSWTDTPGNVSSVTGVHDVYLTFTSGQSEDFVSVDQFYFRH